MPFVNYNNREISVKIVYYGPALSGKTSCLRYIYQDSELDNKGKLITLDTAGDRTLFFDFLPIDLGKISGYTIKIQLYTVPGQVAYDTTRKMVLQGVDGVVFVCDSQKEMMAQNAQSFRNLKKNLELNGISPSEIPILFHYNKQDIPGALEPGQISKILEAPHIPYLPTVAVTGENVLKGLKEITRLVLNYLRNKLTIFQQKDRTMMFSQSNSFAQINHSLNKKNEEPFNLGENQVENNENEKIMDLSQEDIQEEILELKGKEHKMDTPIFNDDDIFDLGDAHQVVENEENVAGGKKSDSTKNLKSNNVTSGELNPFDTFDDNVAKMLNEKEASSFSEEDSSSTLLLEPDSFNYASPEKFKERSQSSSSSTAFLNNEREAVLDNNKQIIQNVPINVIFPKGKDEVTLNLQITLKRE